MATSRSAPSRPRSRWHPPTRQPRASTRSGRMPRSPGGASRVNVLWRRGNKFLRTDSVTCARQAGWHPCSRTLDAPADANNALIRVVVDVGAGTTQFDNVTLLTPQVLPTVLQGQGVQVVD